MPISGDGSFVQWTPEEMAEWEVESRGMRGEAGYPHEVWQVNGTTWEARWFVKYQFRHRFIKYLLGSVSRYTDGSGNVRLSRLPPYTLPNFPKIGVTKVTSVTGFKFTTDDIDEEWEPFVEGEVPEEEAFGPLPMPQYEIAEVVATLEYLPFAMLSDGDTFLDESKRWLISPGEIEASGEFIQLPAAARLHYLGVPGGDKPIPTNQFAVVQSTATFTVSWVNVPERVVKNGSFWHDRVFGLSEYVGGDDIAYINTVNQLLFLDYPPGTLLFNRPRYRFQTSPYADERWLIIDLEMIYKPQGWCYLYLRDPNPSVSGYYFVGPSGGTVYPMLTLPDDYSLYNARDHNLLLSVSATP